MRIEVDKRARAKWMRDNGASIAEVSDTLGVSKQTVLRFTVPGFKERSNAISRSWKERNRYTCTCGALIRHDSFHCQKCANAARAKWTPATIIEAIQRFEREHGRIPASQEWNGSDRGDYPALTSVAHYFGTWNKAITAAGFVPRKSGHREFRTRGAEPSQE